MLQVTMFAVRRTYAITLKFQPGTNPAAAKKQWDRWIRWLRNRAPCCYGYRSVEFAAGRIHYHVILGEGPSCCSSVAGQREELASKWAEISGTKPDEFYFDDLHDFAGYLRYLAKETDQREVPAAFQGSMTRFWGAFGKPPQVAATFAYVKASDQTRLRAALADMIETQDGDRSYPFAQAIRKSVGEINVKLSEADARALVDTFVSREEMKEDMELQEYFEEPAA